MRQRPLCFCVLAVLVAALLGQARAISFILEPDVKQCVQEEVHKDVLVVGEYKVSEVQGQSTEILVSDTKGQTLFHKEAIDKGKFAFTTEDYELFEVCFTTTLTSQLGRGIKREATLHLKHGVEAKNYDDVGKAEKLKPMELELRRLEDLAESIVNDFAYMRAREEEMRDTNESTNTRVLYFSVFSMCCLLFLAAWQIFYLRRFFQAKKLIE